MRQCLLLLTGILMLAGCDDQLNVDYTTPAMKEVGMIYILPGIQGVDSHYTNIRAALIGSGIGTAIMIHPWGCQIPGINLMINETDTRGDREWGVEIAKNILQYQQQYPGKPIYMIGQSGGCAVSVFTAEALSTMPGAQPIEGIILLDASITNTYDLSTAMSMCRKGIVNFYNPADTALLGVGTAVFGNLDGEHGDSAGRVGFVGNYPRLYQVKIKPDMVDDFDDPHFADCSRGFTAQYIAPWIIDKDWPAPYMTYAKDE